jgi:hypothetical protein
MISKYSTHYSGLNIAFLFALPAGRKRPWKLLADHLLGHTMPPQANSINLKGS